MRIELIKHPVRQRSGVKDAVTTVHHMIIERQHHERRIVDDAAKDARVHRVKVRGITVRCFAQAGDRLCAGENRSASHN